MTEQDIKRLIHASIPSDAANRDEIADDLFEAAVLKIGRLPNVSFNTERITFNLTANKQDYIIGVDILSNFPEAWTIQHLWITDEAGHNIKVVSQDEYTANYAGSTTTGKPTRATIHSVDGVSKLSVWPIPDSAYGVTGYARKTVGFADIPDQYHDAIITQAYLIWQARNNASVASALALDNEKDMQGDSRTSWSGSTFRVPRPMSQINRVKRADSYNITGE